MTNETIFWIVIAVLCALGAIALVLMGMRRTKTPRGAALRERFGPEYDRALNEAGSERAARKVLAKRVKRVERYDLRTLDDAEHRRFRTDWERVQARFVDEPSAAVVQAHELVEDLMRARGYPVESIDQEIADLSVHHARVVQHYRAARELAKGARSGSSSTEDLRQAMVHFRALFADLLESESGVPAPTQREERFA